MTDFTSIINGEKFVFLNNDLSQKLDKLKNANKSTSWIGRDLSLKKKSPIAKFFWKIAKNFPWLKRKFYNVELSITQSNLKSLKVQIKSDDSTMTALFNEAVANFNQMFPKHEVKTTEEKTPHSSQKADNMIKWEQEEVKKHIQKLNNNEIQKILEIALTTPKTGNDGLHKKLAMFILKSVDDDFLTKVVPNICQKFPSIFRYIPEEKKSLILSELTIEQLVNFIHANDPGIHKQKENINQIILKKTKELNDDEKEKTFKVLSKDHIAHFFSALDSETKLSYWKNNCITDNETTQFAESFNKDEIVALFKKKDIEIWQLAAFFKKEYIPYIVSNSEVSVIRKLIKTLLADKNQNKAAAAIEAMTLATFKAANIVNLFNVNNAKTFIEAIKGDDMLIELVQKLTDRKLVAAALKYMSKSQLTVAIPKIDKQFIGTTVANAISDPAQLAKVVDACENKKKKVGIIARVPEDDFATFLNELTT